jgi:tetratricopeptide (TPR) repeat protein
LDSEEKDMRFLLCILLLAVRSGQASETSKGWSDWLSEGRALIHTGNYSATTHAFREALAITARSAIDDRQLIVLHDALAGAYAEAGQFAEAEAEYRRALALVENAEGQGWHNYAFVLAQMSILPTHTGNRDEVIGLLRQAIEVNARIGSAENIAVVLEQSRSAPLRSGALPRGRRTAAGINSSIGDSVGQRTSVSGCVTE